MAERLTVSVEGDVHKGDFPVQKILVQEYVEGNVVLVTVDEDGTNRLHQIDNVKEISVE